LLPWPQHNRAADGIELLLTVVKAWPADRRQNRAISSGGQHMLGFIGDHFFVLPLAAAALFMAVVGFVSIEDATRER
jgi:hypothetical protein